MRYVERLSSQLYIIDDYDFQRAQRTGTYVLLGDDITLIETCASPSLPYILNGLRELNISLTAIKNIIVTHVHLDHAGAAGLLMRECPNAKLFVHSRGASHMIDPTQLVRGTRAVYGESFDIFFNPILPIPKERICIVEDSDTLQISANRTLAFYDTPGHAKHHISIHDSLTNGIFTGDTIGIYYRELIELGVELYLPSTSPTQFNPEAMLASKERIKNLKVDYIYFGHYGASANVSEVYTQLENWLSLFIEKGEAILAVEKNSVTASKKLASLLFEAVQSYLIKKGIPKTHEFYKNVLRLEMLINAKGIINYLTRLKMNN
ncbi:MULTISPECIES: MBL fold metallo-hydrolase [Bacillus cereus group]|uniref:MBL fold metallo-hydrolase n=1 Tax=Bacillus cereus group TaxID=86661 RepID=UPI0018F32BF6|nr:MBL fold metallo-hydrolase [Bacillus cereus]MBJ8025806.1 MBL fold metallo-hydrolase [Bacillus cereus]MBJ8037876.1 MBL fold metallo-hydrolase [Bacillus cereus]